MKPRFWITMDKSSDRIMLWTIRPGFYRDPGIWYGVTGSQISASLAHDLLDAFPCFGECCELEGQLAISRIDCIGKL